MNILKYILFSLLFSSAWAQIPLTGKTMHIWLPQGEGHSIEVKDGPGNFTDDGKGWYSFTWTSDPWSGVFFTMDGSWDAQIGPNGMSKAASRLTDSFWDGNTEVWFMLDADGGTPTKLFTEPKQWILHVLNPDDWKLTAPRIEINGRLIAPTLEATCGWFVATFFADVGVNRFRLRQALNQEAFGPYGYEDTTTIDLAEKYTDGTTELWLESEVWNFTKADPGIEGECPTYEMAVTIRDIDGTAHPDFGGNGNQKAPCANITHGMVASTLDPATKKPQYIGSCGVTQFDSWWITDPTAGGGTGNETCRDLPFHKSDDGLWEYDSNDEPNTAYLPIDDFNPYNDWAPKLATATFPKNPDGSYVMWPSGDGEEFGVQWTEVSGQFNLGFCMEMHADFQYTPGQKFDFRGDDDLWVFINNQLVIDVGGTHNPAPGSVLLDTLGLTSGGKYDFDMYFCERQVSGTNLRVKTSIYFEQRKALDYTLVLNGEIPTYEYFRYEGGQGSCESLQAGGIDSTKVTSLTYVLYHRGDLVDTLVSGKNYGGIDISATGELTINKDVMTGLAPGSYSIVPYQTGYAEPGRAVEFRVSGSLSFASGDAFGLAGVLMPVIVGNLIDGIVDPAEIGYLLTIPDGLEVFKDQAGTQVVTPSTMLSTQTTGYDTVWVTGTRHTETDTNYYQLRLSRTNTPGVNLGFNLPDLQFVESSEDSANFNQPLVSPYKLNGRWSYVAYPVKVEFYSADGHCNSCKDTLWLNTSDSLIFINTQGELVNFVLADSGFASFSVMGNSDKIDNGAFIVQGPSSLMQLTWDGINLIKPPVPMVESAAMYDDDGNGIADRLEINYRNNLDSLPVWLEVNWPSDSATVRHPQDRLADMLTSTTKLTVSDQFTKSVLTDGTGTISSMYVFEGEDIISTMPVADRIGPIITEAIITLGDRTDILELTLSEPINSDSLNNWIAANGQDEDSYYASVFDFLLGAEQLSYTGTPLHSWNNESTVLKFYFLSSEREQSPRAGDKVRITPIDPSTGSMGIFDKAGNFAHIDNPWVIITGRKRSTISTIALKDVDPTNLPQDDEPKPITATYSTSTTLSEIQEQSSYLGHLLEVDMSQYLLDGTTQPQDIVLEYHEYIYTNLGAFVGQTSGSVSCADDLYEGDCSMNKKNLFIGWNYRAENGRFAGSGAYIATLEYSVKVLNKRVEKSTKTTVWGVRRTAH